ncbi:MAG TPA: right-handed parallel beta-helix repeat-containing protein [Vicinamibacterales bacterium]|nr:right-handed parallel beta-helix repeat-containing protein [Vicinamibacterales bacterium]
MTPARRNFSIRLALIAAGILGGPFAGVSRAATVPGDYPSIQAAINAVENGGLPNGAVINVQPGVYAEALVVSPSGKSFTVVGVAGANSTVIDAAGKQAAALMIHAATGNVVFRGLTFRHGAPPAAAGGGFVIIQSSPSLVDVIFESNTAVANGGGGGALLSSSATFDGCIIRNNAARNSGGGVLILDGSRPVFANCEITGNVSGTNAVDGVGGGVDSRNSSPTFRGSRISSNWSKFAGGAIYHGGQFGSPYGTSMLFLEDTEVADNLSTPFSGAYNPAEGGGIHIEDNAVATLLRSRVLRNVANTGGGLNAFRARYDIVDSIIDANEARARVDGGVPGGIGGGINAMSQNPPPSTGPVSTVNLTGTLVRNNVGIIGGGIVVTGDENLRATLTLTNSVVDSNRSQDQGGGILVSHAALTAGNSLIIRNSVLGGSGPVGGGVDVASSSTATFGGTTIAHNTAGTFGGGIFVFGGSNIINMISSNVYENTAGLRGGGLFLGGASQSGTIQSSIIADNNGSAQINEEGCTAVVYQNNTITPKSGLTSDQFSTCTPSGGRQTGTNMNTPRFGAFLAAPSAGLWMTLAWSVARATVVNIPGVVTNSAQKTGSADVTPTMTTAYALSASTATGPLGPLNATAVVGTGWGSPGNGDMPVPADYDGDGKDDLAVYRRTSGDWFVIRSSNSTMLQVNWGAPQLGDIPVVADYDGDGKADVAVYRLSTGDWFVIRSSNSTMLQVNWGAPQLGDVPVVGDYDNDGKADVAVYRLTTGQWFVIRSSNSSMLQVSWGAPQLGDVPVVGDYDGDGKSDVGVYRKTTGQWFIIQSSNGSVLQVTWGAPSLGDVPVPADYDGDGRTDVAVARAMTGEWFLARSSAGGLTVHLGFGDARVPADYDGNGRAEPTIWGGMSGRWLSR